MRVYTHLYQLDKPGEDSGEEQQSILDVVVDALLAYIEQKFGHTDFSHTGVTSMNPAQLKKLAQSINQTEVMILTSQRTAFVKVITKP